MFTKATFKFLDDLAANNNRAWFEANKPRYESLVREPALEFITAMGPALEDLKRKDFIALAPLSAAQVTGPGLVKLAGARFAAAAPMMKFLCEALGVPY